MKRGDLGATEANGTRGLRQRVNSAEAGREVEMKAGEEKEGEYCASC